MLSKEVLYNKLKNVKSRKDIYNVVKDIIDNGYELLFLDYIHCPNLSMESYQIIIPFDDKDLIKIEVIPDKTYKRHYKNFYKSFKIVETNKCNLRINVFSF